MIEYKFVARSPTGKKFKGKIKLESLEELKTIMLEHNYQLIKYKIIKKKKIIFELKKINKQDILSFIENLYLIIKAGISLKQGLKLCVDTTSNQRFKEIITDINKEMEKGKPLSVSLNNYDKVFSLHFRTMIYLAEVSGNLKTILEYLINSYRFEINLKKKILSSLFYPILLLIFSIIVIFVVSIVIIPTFVNIFTQMDIELPIITKFMISLSNFMTNYAWIILMMILILILLYLFFRKKDKIIFFLDWLKLKIPLFKKLYILNLSSNFCRNLKILLKSGIPTVSSLETTTLMMNNQYLKDNFTFVIDEVKRGRPIAKSLYTLNIFPPILIETIKISEETANLEYSLDVLCKLFDEEEQNFLQKLVSIIEPCLIIFIAGIVLLVIASIFIPLFSMFDNIGGF